MRTSKTWIITDTHFGHRKLEEWGRPKDFDIRILKNLYKNIQPGDMLIHLGDVCIGNDELWHSILLHALPECNKILVVGNHDRKSNHWYIEHGWNFVCRTFSLTWKGKRILFSHEPKRRINSTYGDFDINIHGHLHGNNHRDFEGFDVDFYDRSYNKDLAPDIHGYGPICFDSLI